MTIEIIPLQDILIKIFNWCIQYSIFQLLLGAGLSSVVRATFGFFNSQAVYNDVLKSIKIKVLISKLSANRALLGASRIIVTRVHNGMKWLNKDHMNKLSIYQTLTIDDYSTAATKYKMIDTVLNDMKLSELSDLLAKVVDISFDIVSVEELPKEFDFKRVLRYDNVKYVVLFKIAKGKKIFGYIWVLFADEDEVVRDKAIYNDFMHVAAEIAEEFK